MVLDTADEIKIETIVDNAIQASEKRLDAKYDKVITILDKIMGELIKSREEQTVLSKHSKDHTDKIEAIESDLEEHEERIAELESSVGFAKA